MGQYGRGYTGAFRTTGVKSVGDYGTDGSPWVYSDINFIFKPSPIIENQAVGGDLARKYDGDAIKQSVKNILLSNSFERPWKPNFGPNIRNLLFENPDSTEFFLNSVEKERDIRDQLKKYEPRISVVSVKIGVPETGTVVNVSVDYKLKPITEDTATNTFIVEINTERVR